MNIHVHLVFNFSYESCYNHIGSHDHLCGVGGGPLGFPISTNMSTLYTILQRTIQPSLISNGSVSSRKVFTLNIFPKESYVQVAILDIRSIQKCKFSKGLSNDFHIQFMFHSFPEKP